MSLRKERQTRRGGGETQWLYYDLSPDACIVRRQGTYEGDLGGPLASRIDRTGRGGFAKILRDPIGEWALQLENREPGRDLNFLIPFAGDPAAGTTATVTSSGVRGPGIGGGTHNPERVGWDSGNVQIQFKSVRPQAGRPFTWVCGTVSTSLVGIKDVPGVMGGVPVPATFSGQFWAEWHHGR